MKKIIKLIVFVSFSAVLYAADSPIYTPTPTYIPPTQSPKSVNDVITSGDWCQIIRDGWVGFKDIKDLDRLSDILLSGDEVAATNFMNVSIINGVALKFDKGQDVYVVDLKVFKEYVKLRRRGDSAEYWAFRKVIEK